MSASATNADSALSKPHIPLKIFQFQPPKSPQPHLPFLSTPRTDVRQCSLQRGTRSVLAFTFSFNKASLISQRHVEDQRRTPARAQKKTNYYCFIGYQCPAKQRLTLSASVQRSQLYQIRARRLRLYANEFFCSVSQTAQDIVCSLFHSEQRSVLGKLISCWNFMHRFDETVDTF